jgi:hypothetical protein
VPIQRVAFDTGNGGQKRVAEPFAMRQIPPETDLELAKFGFDSKGLVGSVETAQHAPCGTARPKTPRSITTMADRHISG